MTLGDITLVAFFVAVGLWAVYRIRRSVLGDRRWSSQLQALAQDRALLPSRVDRGPGDCDLDTPITWKFLKNWTSRNPSVKMPEAGSTTFTGRSNGLAIHVDTVLMRKHWSDLYEEYLRMAVEVPDLPRSLTIYPTGRIGRIARRLGFKQASRGAVQPGNLTLVFSSNPSERSREQGFLSMNRLGVLSEFEKTLGGVYVYDGKVFLIKRRKDANRLGLHALYDNMILLATKLAEAG